MSVKIVNATKVLKGKTILKDINLLLNPGKIYGLLGKNGSGKTMLIRLISGLLCPTKGEVHVFGKHLGKDADFPDSIGLTIENVGFWPQYTSMECLQLLASVRKKIGFEEIRKTLSLLGLDPEDKRKYCQYSLGMKQKLAIAQAVMEKPDLIMLDEPTNSLDEVSVTSIRDMLKEERSRGALIIIASHNQEDIKLLADETINISEGEII